MSEFKESITNRNITLLKLLEVVNNKPSGIAFITDDANKLCGVVTDGDIRRWLLSGYNLDDSLMNIPLSKFTYATEKDSLETLIAKSSERIRVIPIVNEDFELVNYFQYDKRVSIPVAIPDLEGNEFKYLMDAFLSTWISSSGEYITKFEKDFSAFCDTEYGVATSNGTVAIHLALEALRIGKGDEVIVPDLTFAATINAVFHAGATPVIVDVELDSWCIDPEEIEKAITPATKAIIPVHIYGQPCDMDKILAIAKKHNLYVIEDCAEAHGALYNGKKVGSFGDIATFSFFANKIITTGEGGMCLTNSAELSDRMRVLRDHGMNKSKRYWHDEVGYNYRMTNIQAAIGCAQLERIERIIVDRDKLEAFYESILGKYNFIEFQKRFTPQRRRTVWLISMLIKKPELKSAFMQWFKENGIDIRPFFYPLSDMPVYKQYFTSSKSFRNSKLLSEVGISLPTHKEVDLKKFEQVLESFVENFDVVAV